MAEFPGFGQHCNFEDCHLLDFLPVRCDACGENFCDSHCSYDMHQCRFAHKKVPVCPLCSKPVPVIRGERPDKRVSDHIDNDCMSDPSVTLKGKIYSNRCSQQGCRNRELVPIKCSQCEQNFCLRHRFTADHYCVKDERTLPNTANATLRGHSLIHQIEQPVGNSNRDPLFFRSSLSEDEALARAIQESLNECMRQEEYDRVFAEILQRMQYQEAVVCLLFGYERIVVYINTLVKTRWTLYVMNHKNAMAWLQYAEVLFFVHPLFVISVASMVCPGGFGGGELRYLFYGLGYGTPAQICPPSSFFYTYICCEGAYFECCIRFELWFVVLAVVILISISVCCFCCLFAGIWFLRSPGN